MWNIRYVERSCNNNENVNMLPELGKPFHDLSILCSLKGKIGPLA